MGKAAYIKWFATHTVYLENYDFRLYVTNKIQ